MCLFVLSFFFIDEYNTFNEHNVYVAAPLVVYENENQISILTKLCFNSILDCYSTESWQLLHWIL